jgi:glutathione S-transferase
MLALIQFPWSPFCITIRYILTRHHIPFRLHNSAYHDRTPIIKATKGQGHTVPCLIDGRQAIWDLTDFGQEVARYVDRRYRRNLFPKELEGLQLVFSRYIETELEMVGFKVNDLIRFRHVPSSNGRCLFATRSENSEEDASEHGLPTDGICALSLRNS